MQTQSHKSIGRWSIHHPWRALAVWIAFVLACLTLGAISGTKTLDNGAVGQSARGYTIMNRYRLWGPGRDSPTSTTAVGLYRAVRSATSSDVSVPSGSHPSSSARLTDMPPSSPWSSPVTSTSRGSVRQWQRRRTRTRS
jgi:RND superfamily putative drug exporter